ncbi:hypothetical protein GCM10020254_32700 [Streptomyces goshikiensis]
MPQGPVGPGAPDPDEAGLLRGLLDEGQIERAESHAHSVGGAPGGAQSQPWRRSERWMVKQDAAIAAITMG